MPIIETSQKARTSIFPRLFRNPGPAPIRSVRIPGLGRVMFSRDPGSGHCGPMFKMNMFVRVGDAESGKLLDVIPLGSGVMTLAFTQLWANDYVSAAAALKAANYWALGLGTNAEAASDIIIQTPSAQATGGTNAAYGGSGGGNLMYFAGTQAYGGLYSTTGYIAQSTSPVISFGGAEAITEVGWFTSASAAINEAANGVFGNNTLADTTHTPFASGNVGMVATNANPAANTSSNRFGVIGTYTDSGHVIIFGGSGSSQWNTLAGGAGSNPGGAAYSVVPLMMERSKFAALNVSAAVTLQFVGQVALISGS